MPLLHESLADFPVVITVPLHWGDQDPFGHVNNIVYLRWAETARVEYLRRIGVWQRYETERVGPIIARVCCDYRRPLVYPDTVHVGARVTAIGNTSFQMAHRIVSVSASSVAADLESTLVWMDYNVGKPIPVPASMRDAIKRLETA